MRKKKGAIVELNSFFESLTGHLPGFATFEKVLEEVREHGSFVKWAFFRVAVPIIIFQLLLNILFFERFRLSPTIFGVLVFFYGSFFVDLDSFFLKKESSRLASKKQQLAILFFAPVVIYYLLSEKIRPVHLPAKFFHRTSSAIYFSVFLFFVGYLIFFTWWDALFFAILGLCGYLTHILTDRAVLK